MRQTCHDNLSLQNRYRLTMAATLFTFITVRRFALRRSLLVGGSMVWFACPEWGSAYLYPKKPLSDLIVRAAEEEVAVAQLSLSATEDASSGSSFTKVELNKVAQVEAVVDTNVIAAEKLAALKKEAASLYAEK